MKTRFLYLNSLRCTTTIERNSAGRSRRKLTLLNWQTQRTSVRSSIGRRVCVNLILVMHARILCEASVRQDWMDSIWIGTLFCSTDTKYCEIPKHHFGMGLHGEDYLYAQLHGSTTVGLQSRGRYVSLRPLKRTPLTSVLLEQPKIMSTDLQKL